MFEDIPYRNRKDAGKKLADLLTEYKDQHVLVVGIPRGGVEVAYEVAEKLNASLTVVISKKLPFPSHEEFGFGAIAEEGEIFLSKAAERLSDEKIEQIIQQQLQEITRRVEVYRNGLPLPEMNGKVVIIVDDGIATRVTLVPVISLCRKKKAAKVIVASPVAGRNYEPAINTADKVVVAYQPENYIGVGQVYREFPQLSDERVTELMTMSKG